MPIRCGPCLLHARNETEERFLGAQLLHGSNQTLLIEVIRVQIQWSFMYQEQDSPVKGQKELLLNSLSAVVRMSHEVNFVLCLYSEQFFKEGGKGIFFARISLLWGHFLICSVLS